MLIWGDRADGRLLYDLADYEETDSALGAISSSVQAGRTALLAEVVEGSPDVIDAEMSGVGGTVLRRSVADVEAEIAVAEEAERKAKREARKELMRSRHEHDKATVNAKVDALKSKVHRGQQRLRGQRADMSAQPLPVGDR